MEDSCISIFEQGKEFVALQEERVRTYGQLEQAHKRYLDSAPRYDFETYKLEVAKATQTFSNISTQILALERDAAQVQTELASCMRQVQELEREKLALTVEYQLALQSAQDNVAVNDQGQSQTESLRQKLNALRNQISDQMEDVRYILADIAEK